MVLKQYRSVIKILRHQNYYNPLLDKTKKSSFKAPFKVKIQDE